MNIVAELQNIFPDDKIVLDRSEISKLVQNCIPISHQPLAIVYPVTKLQIQDVLKLAETFKTGVWFVSRGKNWGYGSRSPNYSNGILIILEKMNSIKELNEDLGYAVIEPGVSYRELNEFLKEKNSKLWLDPTGSTPDGSVIGNALDKGRGITPYADHYGHLCGVEVVLPTGELLFTDGGPANYQARYTYQSGFGPILKGLFAQSNFGIVVSAGIWLMPRPEAYEFMTFEYSASPKKFADFLNKFRKLMFDGHMRAFPHIANDFAMLCIVDQHPKNGQALSTSEMQSWRKEHGVKDWSFGCGLYGTRTQVKDQKREIRRVLSQFGQVRFIDFFFRPGVLSHLRKKIFLKFGQIFLKKSEALTQTLEHAYNLYRGHPSDFFVKQAYCLQKVRPKGPPMADEDNCGVIWVGPVLPFEGTKIYSFLELIRPVFLKNNFDFFVEVMPTGPRSVLLLLGVFYDKSDQMRTQQALTWFSELKKICHESGYPVYRETLMGLETLFQDNPEFKKALKKIKSVLDPEMILSIGRTGS